jgi:hypothetical protein
MMTFSVAVILVKWTVVFRYKPGNIGFNTWGHMRWWFVEYLVRVWEYFVGCYLLGSPYIAVFYKLMGAKIHIWSMSCNVKVFLRCFDLIECDPGAVLEQLWSSPIMASTLSVDGIHLDSVKVRTQVDKGTTVSPGYCEKEELDASQRPLQETTESQVHANVVMQKLLRPWLYIALVSAVMIPLDFGVDELYAIMGKTSNTSSADEHSTTRTIRAVAAVLYFYVLQIGVCTVGVLLVYLNRVVACHACDTTIDFLVGTPLMFLNGLIAFTPWTAITLKSWGAKLP